VANTHQLGLSEVYSSQQLFSLNPIIEESNIEDVDPIDADESNERTVPQSSESVEQPLTDNREHVQVKTFLDEPPTLAAAEPELPPALILDSDLEGLSEMLHLDMNRSKILNRRMKRKDLPPIGNKISCFLKKIRYVLTFPLFFLCTLAGAVGATFTTSTATSANQGGPESASLLAATVMDPGKEDVFEVKGWLWKMPGLFNSIWRCRYFVITNADSPGKVA
jgi:hypothetical protein